MKRLLSLSFALIAGLCSLMACVRPSATMPQLVGLVTDSSWSLLPEASIQVGKQRLTTSWDGKFVLEAGQWRPQDKLVISCEGYEKQTLSLSKVDTTAVLVITLKALKNKHPKYGSYVSASAKPRSGVMYKTVSLAPTLDMAAGGEMGEEYAFLVASREEVNSPVSAGKLTAGEVNDFAKWQLWTSVLDSTLRPYIKDWRLTARERYTVQVVDKHGYPILNYPVSLADVHGNTVFQAVTDNTGRVELWNGLVGPRAQVNQPQWKDIVVDEPCNAASDIVDVMFVFDATGSMGDELRYLQAEMRDVISRSQQAIPGVMVRTGAVVYRDKGDEYVTRLSRLTSDIATTQSFIDRQEAGGGGDFPEAVPEALMAAINSAGWDETARARIAFLILDAPCHNDSATVALLHEQVLNAAAYGIRIVPVVCSGLDKSGELLMRSIALATNGTSFFLTDDSGIGHTHLKPTTDSLKVEHLNDMLVRTIIEYSYVPDCRGKWHEDEIAGVEEEFVPNPFEVKDLSEEELVQRDSRTTLYLLDVSGKLIYIYQGSLEEAGDAQLSGLNKYHLSTGIYFVKAFYDGSWHTRKILVH